MCVYYCPTHHNRFVNLETFNQNSSQLQAHIYRNDQCQTEPGCTGIIAAVDMTTILKHTIFDALGVEEFFFSKASDQRNDGQLNYD
jgi:hypothetical protein